MCNNDGWKKINMKTLELKNIRKSYNGRCVLDGISAVCSSSQPVCVRGVSGAGKTTLLNIIMGLVNADEGELVYSDEINKHEKCRGNKNDYRLSSVFQESALVGHLNPVINVSMVLKENTDKSIIRNELCKLVDEECIDKPCTQLSGGMKRRVEIVRAMMADSDVVVMDEPFAGLDDKTKDTVIHYIINNIRERVLIISTHDDEDVKKLSAKVLFIDNKVANCYNNV